VNRTTEQARLAPRGATGGAGNFFLNMRVLNAQDGRLIRSLDYEVNRHSRQTQVSIHGLSVYYAISPRGDLVVIDGVGLELVSAGR